MTIPQDVQDKIKAMASVAAGNYEIGGVRFYTHYVAGAEYGYSLAEQTIKEKDAEYSRNLKNAVELGSKHLQENIWLKVEIERLEKDLKEIALAWQQFAKLNNL